MVNGISIIVQKIKAYQIPLIIIAVIYGAILSIFWMSKFIFPDSRVAEIGVFEGLNIWDGPHYLSIAQSGYKPVFVGFFPLYPFLIKIFSQITYINFLASALTLSAIFSFLASIVLYRLVKLDESKNVAFLTVLFQFLFPTTFFFFAPYTESLFLFLIVSTFFLLRTKNFLLAYLCAAFATATRLVGLAIIPAIWVEIYFYHRPLIRRNPKLVVLSVLIPLIGFLCYLLVNYSNTGNMFYFIQLNKEHWYTSFSPQGKGFLEAWESINWRKGTEILTLGYAQVTAAVLAGVSIIYAFFRLRLSYAAFLLIGFFMVYSTSFWLSMPRYVMVLFPIFIFLAKMSQNSLFLYLWIFFSALFFVLFSLIAAQHGSVL